MVLIGACFNLPHSNFFFEISPTTSYNLKGENFTLNFIFGLYELVDYRDSYANLNKYVLIRGFGLTLGLQDKD